jgi:hypothetical protein
MPTTREQKREALRKLGFRRQDRTSGGKHRELWLHKDSCGSLGQSLESCWRHVIKHRFVVVIPETGRLIFWWEES